MIIMEAAFRGDDFTIGRLALIGCDATIGAEKVGNCPMFYLNYHK
jgi:hypothetical protein